ncbi:MAG TPA: amidohydrolase family protein [Candidatus Dormibacteraeota bacterium]|nr:amidohydrolase family protein [Candidatus Dormibacteraeota bacterium]
MKELTAETASGSTDLGLVDCDIHVQPARPDTLRRHLPARWREHDELFGVMGPTGAAYPRARPYAARTDSWPPSGAPPGTDLAFLRAQLLDAWQVSHGVLNPLLNAGSQRNLDFGAALASAINDWLIEEWLEPEPRLRGSIAVAHEDGELAAGEIRRVGRDPRFAQVLLPIRTAEPLGRRKYWPMFAAAVEMGLPIGIHVGGAGGWPVSGAGFHSFYFEDHSAWPAAYQTQVTSLVCEGVFERYPDLRIVLIEGGLAWMASFMWRFDDAHRRLSAEVPELRRPPSEYIRRHFWVTTQPMEEPPRAEQFRELLGQIGMNDHLLFATDYPHWDFDAPDMALPAGLDPDLRRAIMAGNAHGLYRFTG